MSGQWSTVITTDHPDVPTFDTTARGFLCGGPVVWGCDFSFEDYCLDGDGIVSVWHCSHCGADYDVMQRFEEEEENDKNRKGCDQSGNESHTRYV